MEKRWPELHFPPDVVYHDLEQNTPNWLTFRETRSHFRLTASECAAVLGLCKDPTRSECFRVLSKEKPRKEIPQEIADFGHQWEDPLAQFAAAVLNHPADTVHTCGSFSRHGLMASPDRLIVPKIPLARAALMEVKSRYGNGGYQTFPAYMVQMYVQMYCTGIPDCFLVHGLPGEAIEIWRVHFSVDLWTAIANDLREFLAFLDGPPEKRPTQVRSDERKARSWRLLYADKEGKQPNLRVLGRYEYNAETGLYQRQANRTQAEDALLAAWRCAAPQ